MSSIPQSSPEIDDEPLEPVVLSHFVRTLRRYRTPILSSIFGALVLYVLVAVIIFLAAPVQRVTSQPFRLDFEGAATGRFPNGLRFSTADVVNPALLSRVYRSNDLEQFVPFADFSRSIFVLESNPAYDILAADYTSRLADPKITPMDRDRLEREFSEKRESIAKNEYAINWIRKDRFERLPEPIVRKVLADILNTWAEYAVKDQNALAYKISVFSPQILTPAAAEAADPVVSALMLRSRFVRLFDNLTQLQKAPGAALVRAGTDNMSLEELRLRLEEVQRYEIEPLVSRLVAAGTLSPATIQIIRDQADYDQRQFAAAKRRADSIRDTLATYEQANTPVTAPQAPLGAAAQRRAPEGSNETVMPQLSDTFLDRVVDLAARSNDTQYRQRLADDYGKATEAMIPLEQAVAYDSRIIDQVTNRQTASHAIDAAAASAQINGIRKELMALIVRMNDIYAALSRQIYSQGQILTISAPPSTRLARAVDVGKLAIGSVAVLLFALVASVIGAVVHNRIREEESLTIHAAEPV